MAKLHSPWERLFFPKFKRLGTIIHHVAPAGPNAAWDAAVIRQNAERFSAARFREQFEEFVENEWSNFRASRLRDAAEPYPFRGAAETAYRPVRAGLLDRELPVLADSATGAIDGAF